MSDSFDIEEFLKTRWVESVDESGRKVLKRERRGEGPWSVSDLWRTVEFPPIPFRTHVGGRFTKWNAGKPRPTFPEPATDPWEEQG